MEIKKEKHIPVLLNELVENIEIFKNKQNIIVDCTLWMWWHASKIIDKLNKDDIFIWFDADEKNLEEASKKLKSLRDDINFFFIHSNFWNLKQELEKIWIKKISWIYYDLWLSSLHIDEAERWFSFMNLWPLDMRLDKSKWETAKQIINSSTEKDLREIFIKYWESSQANKIAKRIIEKRKKKKFETTIDLAEIIDWWPKEKSKIFQAIRIKVNKELENIEKSINDSINLLEKDSKIFVISFHSLEDRIVKNIFRRETKDCICSDLICSCNHKKSLKLITKKPIIPTENEIKTNKRSRSAKARCAIKL